MKVVVSARFRDDFERIMEYLVGLDPKVALKVSRELESALDLLIDFPHLGQPVRRRKTRRFVTSAFGYLVYYAVHADALEFVALTHGRQKRPFPDA